MERKHYKMKAGMKESLLGGVSLSCSVTVHNKAPGWGLRHVFLVLANLGCCLVSAMRVDLSVALVAMVNNTVASDNITLATGECVVSNGPEIAHDTTSFTAEGEFNWSAEMQGLILGALFYGYITTPIICGFVSDRFSAKAVITASLLMSSFLTLMTPLAANYSAAALVVVRVLMGIAQGFFLAALYVLLARWSHPIERSKFATVVLVGLDIGTTFSQPITGFLCQYGFSGGWPSVFYVFGSCGMIWLLVWVLLVHDSPAVHPWISQQERAYLLEKCAQEEAKPNPPWLAILTSVPFWALAFAHFSRNWGYYTLLTTLPTFMNNVLGFDISENGLFSALPYLSMLTSGLIAGQIADFLRGRKILNTTFTRKLINTIAMFGSTIFLVMEGFVHCNRIVGVVLLCLSTAFLGLNYGGAFINHLDIAPRYAGTLMGITNTVATLSGMVSPMVATAVTNSSSDIVKWRIVFYITGAIYVGGAVVFLLFASGREQPWAKDASYSYIPGINVETSIKDQDDVNQNKLTQSVKATIENHEKGVSKTERKKPHDTTKVRDRKIEININLESGLYSTQQTT